MYKLTKNTCNNGRGNVSLIDEDTGKDLVIDMHIKSIQYTESVDHVAEIRIVCCPDLEVDIEVQDDELVVE